ncbi:hypothetical protein EBBID32_770 [Sphingobium indicum BiD32]|uniref:Uncharacterized protein n=1 Tax=Sphingobium indicum BiD32 TaxID=1301087 RepID=N1MG67_9SPHN|nr:hypothetical protein EBBID32_770 [Sphingobium indicum BiD32]
MIATAISTSADAKSSAGAGRYYCGEPPIDWSPPWEKRRTDGHDRLACHLMLREQRKKLK